MSIDRYLEGADWDPADRDAGPEELRKVLENPPQAVRLLCNDERRRCIEDRCGLRASTWRPWVESALDRAFDSLDLRQRAIATVTSQSLLSSDDRSLGLGIERSALQRWLLASVEPGRREQPPAIGSARCAGLLFVPSAMRSKRPRVRESVALLIREGLWASFGVQEPSGILKVKLAAIAAASAFVPDADSGETGPDTVLEAAGLSHEDVNLLKSGIGDGRLEPWVRGPGSAPVDIERLWQQETFRSAVAALGFMDLDPATFDPDPTVVADPWVRHLRSLAAQGTDGQRARIREVISRIPAAQRRSRSLCLQALASLRCSPGTDVRAIAARELDDWLSQRQGEATKVGELVRFRYALFSSMLADRLSLSDREFESRAAHVAGPISRKWFSGARKVHMQSIDALLRVDFPVDAIKELRPESMAKVEGWEPIASRCREWQSRVKDLEAAADAARSGRSWLVAMMQRCDGCSPPEYDDRRGVLTDSDRATVQGLIRARASGKHPTWYRQELPIAVEMRLMEAHARVSGDVPEGLRPVAEAMCASMLRDLEPQEREWASEQLRHCVASVVTGQPSAPAAVLAAFRRGDSMALAERLRGADVELPVRIKTVRTRNVAAAVYAGAAALLAVALLAEPASLRSFRAPMPFGEWGGRSGATASIAHPAELGWTWLPEARVWVLHAERNLLGQFFGPRVMAELGLPDKPGGEVPLTVAEEFARRYRIWCESCMEEGVPTGPEANALRRRWSQRVDVRLPSETECAEAARALGISAPVWAVPRSGSPRAGMGAAPRQICVVIHAPA
jgi:hypothetical protein